MCDYLRPPMKRCLSVAVAVILASLPPLQAEPVLVESGVPKMTLVTAVDAAEFTVQAAEKLNRYIEEISGTRLPTAQNTA